MPGSGDREPLGFRLVLGALSVSTAWAATFAFIDVLSDGGNPVLEVPLTALFAILFGWISLSFWTATLGFARCLGGLPSTATFAPDDARRRGYRSLPRTAIVMPIHNEDPSRAFAGLKATFESLRATGCHAAFDFFVLSDTTDPEIWLEEELAWGVLVRAFPGEGRFYYRRRERNVQRKSGNISEFCRRWGGHYEYMIVLDADSTMEGDTLLELVRRMQEDPDIGILQTSPLPVGTGSLFSRAQAFAASVYGKIFNAGYARWTHIDGNYWGHNAIIRIRPFAKHCGLPRLPGRAPFGGEILSHDFVEAALMRRAGWKVLLAEDLAGSYEECPSTIVDFAKRDHRWCQGNLQHLRLVFAGGFRPVSRLHLGMGAMAYLSSPLWLLFMLLGIFDVLLRTGRPDPGGGPWGGRGLLLFALSMALLLLPKAWGYILLLREADRLAKHGGAWKAGLSVLVETVISALLAPVMMAYHTAFVLSTLMGSTVTWRAQRRGGVELTLREAVSAHGAFTNGGCIAALAVALVVPRLFGWLLPVMGGLALSIPASMVLASVRLGGRTRSAGLLLTPHETEVPTVLRREREDLAWFAAKLKGSRHVDRFTQVVLDPGFLGLHLALLAAGRAENGAAPPLEAVRRVALYGRSEHLSDRDKLDLLADEPSLRWLHREAWTEWPMDTIEGAVAASRIYAAPDAACARQAPAAGGEGAGPPPPGTAVGPDIAGRDIGAGESASSLAPDA